MDLERLTKEAERRNLRLVAAHEPEWIDNVVRDALCHMWVDMADCWQPKDEMFVWQWSNMLPIGYRLIDSAAKLVSFARLYALSSLWTEEIRRLRIWGQHINEANHNIRTLPPTDKLARVQVEQVLMHRDSMVEPYPKQHSQWMDWVP